MTSRLSNYPLLTLLLTAALMWVGIQIGQLLGKRKPISEEEGKGFDLITSATLTLLGLIIGFSFSMAVSRYDLRKAYEEEEANAIGTEYVRAGLLSGESSAKVKTMLKEYLEQRLRWYTERDPDLLGQTDQETLKLQDQMWTVVQDAAVPNQTATMGLVLSGMNDVLNRQGYTQAAWWNRIPRGAWVLMVALSFCSCVLVGYGARWKGPMLAFVLPIIIAVAFFLIADIDSPRRGVIRVAPQNLISLRDSLRGQ
ncbi:MAG TPA: hypothetical protein VMT56_03765 [Candidatus Bathyarchaeia archaeon]|nr:hypothetical protein [Candidatus Bathyarchaeia archaeon]